MKEIKAYIKKRKLDDVIQALRQIDGLTGLSIVDSRGFGAGWHGSKGEEDCQVGVKIEIICLDELVSEISKAIEKAAHTGLKGDGKIYVSSIEHSVRISTGEWGEEAV